MASCSGRIGVGQHRNPFVGMNGRTVVQIRADIYLLDAALGPEITETAGKLTDKTPGSGLRITAPEEDHVAVFGHVLDAVVGRIHHTDDTLTPDVLRSPVKTFPAVRITNLLGETAQHFQQSA